MNIDKFNKWLFEEKDTNKRNVYILIGPPAVGKSSWVTKNVVGEKITVSKDDIIEKVIFPKYNLANNQIFKSSVGKLEVGDEHPDNKSLGKVISYKRFSRSKGEEVEEKAFEKAKEAGDELNKLYEDALKKAIESDIKNIVVDAIHMNKSTRKASLEFFDNKQFNIIGVVFPHEGYEQQIQNSAYERAKDFVDRFGKDFDRNVYPEDYKDIYSKYQPPSKEEGFDELITYNRFDKTDLEGGFLKKESLSEKLVRVTKEYLNESSKHKLSKYWQKRVQERSKRAKREKNNPIDIEWAKIQQEKSEKINKRIHKIFQREIDISEDVIKEIENLVNNVKAKNEERKKRKIEKAKFLSPKQKRPKKKLGNPYKDAKVTKKYPYSKDRTGGVSKVYRRRSKNSGASTVAPGEAFGPIGENQSDLFDSLTDIQKENFHKLIGEVEEYDILKLKQGKKKKNILTYFNLGLEDAIELIQKCPALSKPLESLLTAGTKGFIYSLKNGHVLKLYQEDYTGGSDMYWYKATKARIFGSSGNITDLPIYDEGEIKLDNGQIVNYVEMARVIPLSDFMENTGRSAEGAEEDYELCKMEIGVLENSYGSKFMRFDSEKFVNVFKDNMQKQKIRLNALTKPEFINLARTIFLFMKSGTDLNDSHVGNIGILPQSKPTNPVFVIFDN